MFNTKLPTQSELPTSRQLLRSTVIAVGVAAALLVSVVMPRSTPSTQRALAAYSA